MPSLADKNQKLSTVGLPGPGLVSPLPAGPRIIADSKACSGVMVEDPKAWRGAGTPGGGPGSPALSAGAPAVGGSSAAAAAATSQYLLLPCGIIKGALTNLGVPCTVTAEVSTLPACSFTVRIKN